MMWTIPIISTKTSQQIIENKKRNSGSSLGQAKHYGGIKPINGIP
jgi:hypothetical protein